MATTYKEFVRRVMINLQPRNDGIVVMAVEQAVNDAQKVIACVKDFDELMTLDTTNAATVADQKLYHVEDDFSLVRPKDLYSMRLMDTANSRKLTYIPFRALDDRIPYTEMTGTGKSKYYTVRGNYVELYPIPDDAYDLYVQHSQWPAEMDEETDETPFANIDHVIIALSTAMALSSLEGGSSDWMAQATKLLGISTKEDDIRPDRTFVAQPFCSTRYPPLGQYWLNPFVKRQPD